MLQAASEKCGVTDTCYEMSLNNADKGKLSQDDPLLMSRVVQFKNARNNPSLVLTNAKLFIDKARLMPNCHFVIGYDTYIRILNPKYYNDSTDNLRKALDEFRQYGTKFIVAGRLVDGEWETPNEDLNLVPEGYKDLFLTLTEEEFRMDISSTELRN